MKPWLVIGALILVRCAMGVETNVVFSLDVKGAEDVLSLFPLRPDSTWRYANVATRVVGGSGKSVTVRWESRVSVSALHRVADGLLAEMVVEPGAPAYDISSGIEPDKERLVADVQEIPRYLYFISYTSKGYVYGLPVDKYDPAKNKLSDEVLGSLDRHTPDFFFPMQVGLVWSERSREEADRQQAELFSKGQGEAPNPVHYYWTVESKEDISTPVGTFKDVFVLQYAALDGIERVWFSEKTGIVKRQSLRGPDETVSVLTAFSIARAAQTDASAVVEEAQRRPVVISDRLYYVGEVRNMGASLHGKFNSFEGLALTFLLEKEIGTFDGKLWRLRDILVRVNFDGKGNVAQWEVSGPQPLIQDYVHALEKEYFGKTLLYDFSWHEIDFRPTGFFETEDAEHSTPSSVELSLTSAKRLYRIGEPVVLNVDITNRSKEPMTLVFPQGGSERGWRYPHCIFSFEGPDGREAKLFRPACKTVDPLPLDSFFVLQPAETKPLYEGGFPLDLHCDLSKAGGYTVTVCYSTESEKEWEWYGSYTEEYWNARGTNEFWKKQEPTIQRNREHLREVTRLAVKSNRLPIELAERLLSQEEALAKAKEVCVREGWSRDRLHLQDDGQSWIIHTNWGALGRNGFIRLNKRTGEVIEKHMTGP